MSGDEIKVGSRITILMSRSVVVPCVDMSTGQAFLGMSMMVKMIRWCLRCRDDGSHLAK